MCTRHQSGKCSFGILGTQENTKKSIKKKNINTPESFWPKHWFTALSGNAKMVKKNAGESIYRLNWKIYETRNLDA